MSNYPDLEDRLKRLEEQVAGLQKKLKEIVQWLRGPEKLVEPAVAAQSIRELNRGLSSKIRLFRLLVR